MAHDLQTRIARRLKTLREDRGLTQQQLSRRLGFNDRQTLSAIESMERQVSAEELARAAEVLAVDIGRLTDPFRLEGEGEFSFRVSDDRPDAVDAFQEQAGRWIATYRELSVQAGERPSHLATKLELTKRSSFEETWKAAEELRSVWKIGEVPANGLQEAIERHLGALVLHVDAPAGISGAATRLPGLNTILINRQEAVGRRHFDLAHELFHLLTWEAMPPSRVEAQIPKRKKGKRVEWMAENFAAAMLMPEDALEGLWEARGDVDVHDWLNLTATHFRVSAQALKWRMHNLGHLSRQDVEGIDDQRLVDNGGTITGEGPPPLFSSGFVGRVHGAVESGRLSLRRASKLLGLTVQDFAATCRQYGLRLSYEV